MKASAPLSNFLPETESRLLRTHADLDRFESILYAALPPQYWSGEIRKCVQFIENRFSKAQSHYYRAVAAKEPAAQASAPLAPERGRKSESISANPDPAIEPAPHFYLQTIEVRMHEGVATTKIAGVVKDAWLNGPPLPEDTLFCRQISFTDAVLPDHYAQIMRRHRIATEPVPRTLFLEYKRDAFFSVCRQEQESHSEHLLEGEPVLVWSLV